MKVKNFNGSYKVETRRGPTSVFHSSGSIVAIQGRFSNSLVTYLIDNDDSISNSDSKMYKASIKWHTAIASIKNSPVLMNVAIEPYNSN